MVDRPLGLALAQHVSYDGRTWQVVALSGSTVTLRTDAGDLSAVLLTHLVACADFEVLDQPGLVPLAADSLLQAVDPAVRDRVRRLESHILQVDTGLWPSDETAADVRYALSVRVNERVKSKVAELAGTDLAVSIRQLHRLRIAYRNGGVIGLLERRAREQLAGKDPLATADDRVLSALRVAMNQRVQGSTITRKTMFIQVRAALAKSFGGQLEVPSDRELYRLTALLDQGRHTFGAATTRRTNDNRPERPFTSSVTLRPGEQVQIDTNTIDIMCRYGDGIARRAELTIAVDVATRTILAGVIAPSTKAVDATAVLARMVVPQPLRPGWPEALMLARSGLPFEPLVSLAGSSRPRRCR